MFYIGVVVGGLFLVFVCLRLFCLDFRFWCVVVIVFAPVLAWVCRFVVGLGLIVDCRFVGLLSLSGCG